MKIISRRYILLFFSLLLAVSALAFGKEDHVADMRRIFPFIPFDPANKKIEDFYYLVNSYIDYTNFPSISGGQVGTPLCIKNDPKLGNMKFANHRVWFHWGFNKNPRTFQPLVDMVEYNVKYGIIPEADREYFWYVLNKEIRKRNRLLMDKWAKISGYNGLVGLMASQRAQSNAFVTLLYSIHILGDHQTSETSVIIDKRSLYGDIYNAIDNLAGKFISNQQKAKSLKNKLRIVQGNPKAFFDKMEKEFTPFLYSLEGIGYNYKKKFSSLGYKLKSC